MKEWAKLKRHGIERARQWPHRPIIDQHDPIMDIDSHIFAVEVAVPCADMNGNFSILQALPVNRSQLGMNVRQTVFSDHHFC